jgi:hypothetical protein
MRTASCELLRPLRDRIRREPVDAEHGEREPEPCEHRQQEEGEAARAERRIGELLEWLRAKKRLCGVDCRDRYAHRGQCGRAELRRAHRDADPVVGPLIERNEDERFDRFVEPHLACITDDAHNRERNGLPTPLRKDEPHAEGISAAEKLPGGQLADHADLRRALGVARSEKTTGD